MGLYFKYDVLWMVFFAAILNEAFRSSDHKIFFSFILGCPQDINFARPFWYGCVETGLNMGETPGQS